MSLPQNRWCDGTGRAAKQSDDPKHAHCTVCGYRFYKTSGVVPKHRPKFDKKRREK